MRQNIINELPEYVAPLPSIQPVDGATFRADTAEYLRESAKLQGCNEEEAIAQAQVRFEHSGISVDAFDALVTQAIMASVTQTYANGDAWLRHVTDYLDAELQIPVSA